MSTPLTIDRAAQGQTFDGYTGPAEQPALDSASGTDSNSIRWVFAATVLFWVVVYAAGHSFF